MTGVRAPLGALLLLPWLAAQAGAATCAVSATPLAFGPYSTTTTVPTTSTATVSVSCQSTVSLTMSYAVALSPGLGGSYGARQMQSGGAALAYQIYLDAAHSQIWGNGTGGTGTTSSSYLLSVAAAVTNSYIGYGVVPAQQNAKPGSYTDTITATISF